MEEDPLLNITCHVVITGRVQGVGYRHWVHKKARSLGLSGWVRNLENGSVNALFYGPKESIEIMVEACQAGPQHATVEHIHQRRFTDTPSAIMHDMFKVAANAIDPTDPPVFR
jgi:acylphosphatase